MDKVLHVMDGLGRGGAQAFVMNYIEGLHDKGIACDFLIRRNNSEYTDLINHLSGKVVLTAPFPKSFIKNYFQTRDYLMKHGDEYCAIHVHANALLYLLPLKIAKKQGIPVRIIHSHNTQTNVKWLKPLHMFNRKIIDKWANVFLACGQDAGHWMFNQREFIVVNNCIDENKFRYDENNRKKIRYIYDISDDCTLIGHVGAFKPQKNHKFIIRIFKEYHQINENSKLILLGTGIDENEIKEYVKNEGMSDIVIFAGAKGDIFEYYHAMDAFLFPSLFEGLPFSLVEAQMSGLPSLASANITDEVVVSDLVNKMSLDENEIAWAKALDDLVKKEIIRTEYADTVSKAGYGIKESVNTLVDIYKNESKRGQ